MLIGPRDNQLYVAIGDLNEPNTILQNYKDGKRSNYSSTIIRIIQKMACHLSAILFLIIIKAKTITPS